MNQNRRNFLRRTSLLGASLVVSRSAEAQQPQAPKKPAEAEHQHHDHQPPSAAKPSPPKAGSQQTSDSLDEAGFRPVITPDLPKLPFKLEKGVKVFELVAEPVRTEFLRASSWSDARVVDAWGYNGSVPGPTIEVQEGDRVRIIFKNNLPEPTTPHWHGLEVPMDQDGVPGIGQPLIMPGETHVYEFTLRQNGTYFYHSHMAMQEMLGMIGLFIVHPKRPHEPRVDKDFAYILQGWAILPNNTIPNTLAMEFNWLTMNGKSGPDTTPMIVKQGERVRMRFVNLSMDHHPIHLHGHQFYVTGTEGGRIPESAWFPGNTAIVGVAQARDVEFVAQYEGDWMVHCHLPHHMMNQMVSMVGPMNHSGHVMQTGQEISGGMGIAKSGGALSEEMAPAFGRATGVPFDQATSNAIGQGKAPIVYSCPMHPEVMSDKAGKCPKCGMNLTLPAARAQGARRVPGYPQDMWMTMDAEVARPETSWLPESWTGAMMGMMTLVRVLPSEKYGRMMALIRENRYEPGPKWPAKAGAQEHKHED
ncbi:MAG: multicopper oxidase domain-containing protein [Blastocatellia bacterium]